MMELKCFNCFEVKDSSEFHRSHRPERRRQHQYYCKACHKESSRHLRQESRLKRVLSYNASFGYSRRDTDLYLKRQLEKSMRDYLLV